MHGLWPLERLVQRTTVCTVYSLYTVDNTQVCPLVVWHPPYRIRRWHGHPHIASGDAPHPPRFYAATNLAFTTHK